MRKLVHLVVLFLALLALPITAFADEKADEPKADDKKHDAQKDKDAPHAPVKMTVGIHLTRLNKFDVAASSYNAEFILTIKCDREPCKGDLDVSNGKITGKEKL